MSKTSEGVPLAKGRRSGAKIAPLYRLLNFDFKNNVETREIFMKLGEWSTLQKKNVPLLDSYHDEPALTFELLKVIACDRCYRPGPDHLAAAGDGAPHRRSKRSCTIGSA